MRIFNLHKRQKTRAGFYSGWKCPTSPRSKAQAPQKKEKSRLHPFCADAETLKWLAEYAPFEKLAIVHAGVQQEAEQMLAQIKHFLPQGEIPIVQIMPVLGAHPGVALSDLPVFPQRRMENENNRS